MNRRAFTLVELLIVMVILSVTLTVLYSCFQTGLSAYRRTESVLAEGREGDLFIKGLDLELKNALPYLKRPFVGKPNAVSFPAQVARYTPKGVERELCLVEYRFEGHVLTRTEQKLRKDKLQEEEQLKETVLDHLNDCRFAFLFAAADQKPEWHERWPNQPYAGLPRGVRVTLAGDGFGGEEKSYDILVPHGVLLETAP